MTEHLITQPFQGTCWGKKNKKTFFLIMLMCFSLELKLTRPAPIPFNRVAVQPPVCQCRIVNPDIVTLAFKRLLRGWSDYSVPVFWERTIHTAVCGVNAKQTYLAHASLQLSWLFFQSPMLNRARPATLAKASALSVSESMHTHALGQSF